MTVALSHGGSSMFTSPSRSDQVAIGTIDGVVFIERDSVGNGWHVANRALQGKHVHALIVEETSGTIFAGLNKGSVYASADGGRNWERRDNGLSEDDVYSLASSPHNGGVRVYAGTEPAHLFCSDDLGHTWSELSGMRSVDMSRWTFPAPPNIAHAKHIDFHPEDPDTLFVSIEQGGLLKSTDAGNSFQTIEGMDDDVHRVAISPRDPGRILVTGGCGIFATSDGGANWEQWTTNQDDQIGGYPDCLVFHPRDPGLMFICAAHRGPGSWPKEHFAGSRISRSTDGGRTWQVLGNGLPDRARSAFEAMSLEDWGESFSVFAATASGEVWCSDDGGETWSEIFSDLAPVSKGTHYKLVAA